MTVVPLRAARDQETFGGKAASLARALAAGLPVPDGLAASWDVVARIAAGDAGSGDALISAFRDTGASRVAVRSSAVGEDSLDASFAGQHATVLNVTDALGLLDAVRVIHASAHSDAATAYRTKLGLAGEARIGVAVQRMVDSASAGVLFTRDPITGANERVIESAWGLGESVVAGLVTPDRFRVSIDDEILERRAGHKDIAIRFAPTGGTVETPVPPGDAARLTLDDSQLHALHRLASRCEETFGGAQDIEWAFADGEVYLLQVRPITRGAAIAPPASTPALTPRRFAGLALAALLAPLNSTIIAVALPSMAGAFAVSPAVITRWMVTSYLVVSIVAQSPAGKLADRWGYSRVLTIGRALFGLGALLAAFSPVLPVLGTGRVLMALGGALAVPTVFAQLRNSVPRERRGRIFGIFGAVMSSAAAIGPVLGAFLTTRYGWHSIFIVNVPVVPLSFLLEPPARRSDQAVRRAGFDFTGSALLGIAVILLVVAVNRGALIALSGLIAAGVFVWHELRTTDPVLDVRLFTRRPFAAGSVIVALQNLAMYSMLFLLPFFLARGGSATSETGRMLLLFTAAMVLASPVGGRLSDAIGARTVTTCGAILAASGAMLFVARGDTTTMLIASLALMGTGIGISTSPSQASALGAVPGEQAGVASGALSTMRYIGGVLGSGVVALIAAGGLRHDARLLIFPAVLLASAGMALLLPGRQGATTAGAG